MVLALDMSTRQHFYVFGGDSVLKVNKVHRFSLVALSLPKQERKRGERGVGEP